MDKRRQPDCGSLFETPLSRVLEQLPNDAARVFDGLVDEPFLDHGELRNVLTARLDEIEAIARDREFVDLESARSVASRLERLIDAVDPAGPEAARRLVAAAVRYFLVERDAERDTTSILGFDDDACVVEAVASELRIDVAMPGGGARR